MTKDTHRSEEESFDQREQKRTESYLPCREQRAESRGQRAESREERAESREQRAKSREQRAPPHHRKVCPRGARHHGNTSVTPLLTPL
jgi:hypothetical protein